MNARIDLSKTDKIRDLYMDGGKYNGLGYDAKHVSHVLQVARDHFADGAMNTVPEDAISDLAASEFNHSAALAAKFRAAVERHNSRQVAKGAKAEARAAAKAAKSEAPVKGEVKGYKDTEVKVGRWTYPAREYTDGSVERNTKRDGSGEWVAA